MTLALPAGARRAGAGPAGPRSRVDEDLGNPVACCHADGHNDSLCWGGRNTMADDEVRGDTVLITGGTRGIGAGIARRFLLAGADVVVCGRREPPAPVPAGGRAATVIAPAVRDPPQADRLIAAPVQATGDR